MRSKFCLQSTVSDVTGFIGENTCLPSFFGIHLKNEIDALDNLLVDPKKPVVSVIGGSKVSTKIGVLTNLIKKMDNIVIDGAMANKYRNSGQVCVSANRIYVHENKSLVISKNTSLAPYVGAYTISREYDKKKIDFQNWST